MYENGNALLRIVDFRAGINYSYFDQSDMKPSLFIASSRHQRVTYENSKITD